MKERVVLIFQQVCVHIYSIICLPGYHGTLVCAIYCPIYLFIQVSSLWMHLPRCECLSIVFFVFMSIILCICCCTQIQFIHVVIWASDYLSIYVSMYLSSYLFRHVSVYLFICLRISVSIYLSIRLRIYLLACLSFNLYVHLCSYRFKYLFIDLLIYLS